MVNCLEETYPPLTLLVAQDSYTHSMVYLIEAKADLTVTDENGSTALHLTALEV